MGIYWHMCYRGENVALVYRWVLVYPVTSSWTRLVLCGLGGAKCYFDLWHPVTPSPSRTSVLLLDALFIVIVNSTDTSTHTCLIRLAWGGCVNLDWQSSHPDGYLVRLFVSVRPMSTPHVYNMLRLPCSPNDLYKLYTISLSKHFCDKYIMSC